jgi:hypothetical protein
MKRMFVTSLTAAVAMLAVVVAGGAPASANQQVPFNARYAGDFGFTSPNTAAYGGPGVGQHLGASQMNGTIALLAIVNPGTECANGGFKAEHTDTMSAADGSQLTLKVIEIACQTTATSGQYRCVGTYSVVGGTGRFAGATGQGTFDGLVSFNTGKFDATYNGTISVR